MLIELHMLKNFPPTNLNRDDSGSPKSAYFGDVQRGRISSQCLKRSWRTNEIFSDAIGNENMGIRTRALPEIIAKKLEDMGIEKAYIDAVKKMLLGLGKNAGGKEEKEDIEAVEETGSAVMKQIGFFSKYELEMLPVVIAEMAKTSKDLKEFKEKLNDNKKKVLEKEFKKANIGRMSVDMALFGRMITSDLLDDVQAAVQVAHAISTNAVNIESDYFTAMDEYLEAPGAAMIGDVDFNSCCYYIYASIDVDKLKKNLKIDESSSDEEIQKIVSSLIESMALVNPSGKQNTFAGNILPDAVLIECKERKIPVSYVNAYAEPAKATKNGDLIKNSIEKLAKEIASVDKSFGLPASRLWFCPEKYSTQLKMDKCQNYSNFYSMLGGLKNLI